MFHGEVIYDHANYMSLIGDGKQVIVNGEVRMLSRMPPPMGAEPVKATPFAMAGIPRISPSNYSAAIAEQKARKRRVSDFIDFDAFDQDGLPTCWAIGTAQCLSTQRRLQRLRFIKLSGCSLAVPISGGHVGGWEGDSLKFAAKYGVASTDVWPENNTSRRLIDDPKVAESRKYCMALEYIDVGNDENAWASGLLQGFTGVFAYNWMSHVMMMSDFVEIEKGSFGFRPRNSWGNWGAKNDLGKYGFAVYRTGRGTPSSGYLVRQVNATA